MTAQATANSAAISALRMVRIPAAALAAVLLIAPGAPAFAGGAAAPSATGGSQFDAVPVPAKPPVEIARFTAPASVTPGGVPVEFVFRLRGTLRRTRVELQLIAQGATIPAVRLPLGNRRVGPGHRVRWRPPAALAAGSYDAVLRVRGLRPAAHAALSVAPPVIVRGGRFPIQGAYDFGGPDARFGAEREGHIHEGQDILAAEGTPVIAPVAGVIFWRAYQAHAAGHFMVLRGDDGNDYVFMHLLGGSPLVGKDDRVSEGQQLAQIGSSGSSSAPHLHFELWPDGWYGEGSRPVDPLPTLLRWAAGG